MPRHVRRPALFLLLLVTQPAVAQEPDPYLWLEEVESPRALEWVEAQNRTTVAELTRHEFYQPIFQRVRAVLESRDRLAIPAILGEQLYNFWQDADHPRGIWRRTTWASYLGGSPEWETVLDIDALARAENVPWAYGGATCLPPAYRRCLVRLSRGGSDAVQVREFDTRARAFIEGGFTLPEAKQSAAWVDENTLLVATDFGPGSLTTSGYARQAKLWRRDTLLGEARLIHEAPADHMSVNVGTVRTADRTWVRLTHTKNFYEATAFHFDGDTLHPISVPTDASTYFLRDQILVYLRSGWETGGRSYPANSLIATSFDDFVRGSRDFQVVLAAGERESIRGVSTTRDFAIVSMLDNVRGELRRFRLRDGRWVHDTVPAPAMGSVGVAATTPTSNRYLFTYSGYTQPTTLLLADEDGSVRELQRMPAQFDASGLVVTQHEAVSKDSTRIPYFIVHRRDLQRDGGNPTLLYGYGGFESAQTPGYNTTVGAAWLERGGVYVVANIRGGGEFGPAWHRAALKENRQRAYDDFIAVAEDLIARRITTPARLGIMGGSNGGLLVGVALTQRPELFNAVVIQVPLLDMRRYHQLLAGASWMAEYGNPDVPGEWEYIRRYSPYQNVRADARYPKVLFTTTTRDDRVHPGHARKMAARLAEAGHPFYYFENTEGGHGSGVTGEQRARSIALTYTYLWERLGRPLM